VSQLEDVLREWLPNQRWYGGKGKAVTAVRVEHEERLSGGEDVRHTLLHVTDEDGRTELYQVLLGHRSGEVEPRLKNAVVGDVEGRVLYDAVHDPEAVGFLLQLLAEDKKLSRLAFTSTAELDPSLSPRVMGAEQSNTSVVFGDRLILKLFRRLEHGLNPDIEIGAALTDARFEHMPQVGGWLAYRSRALEPAALGIVQQYMPNEGDVWEVTLDAVSAYYERAAAMDGAPTDLPGSAIGDVLAARSIDLDEETAGMIGAYIDVARLLGRRTAQLHRALAERADDAAFAPEPFTALYQRSLVQTMRNQAQATFATLAARADELPDEARAQATAAAALSDEVQTEIRRQVSARPTAVRIRTHGDFHAGQVLWTGKDVVIIDFEGEPGRPLSERRHKRSALSDVAGMMRSFHYAAFGTLLNPRVGGAVRVEDVARLEPWAGLWYLHVAAAYLDGYLDEAAGQPFVPSDEQELRSTLELATLQKVLYELDYELNNRPDWVSIPLRGLLDLFGRTPEQSDPAPA
jgi:maltose alpha-D-glucosyltransferase/alpha-amylase